MKRWLTLMLTTMLLFSCALGETTPPPESEIMLGDLANGDETILEVETPEYVTLILDVARAELGYTEGAGGYSKYGEWSGDPKAAWCAEFVCWCVDQADQKYGLQLLEQVYPKYSGQNTGRDWYIKRGRFINRKGNLRDWGYQWLLSTGEIIKKGDYAPYPGDLVFFSYSDAGDTAHVALVEYCAKTKDGRTMIHVIEGNNPSSVQRNTYDLANSQVLGFGTPVERAGTTMRFGNNGDKVKKLQSDLNYLGLLDERHLTGTFGSNTRKAIMDFQATMDGKTATGLCDRETQAALAIAIAEKQFADDSLWIVTED